MLNHMTVINQFMSCRFFDTEIDALAARGPINYLNRFVELPSTSAVAALQAYVHSQDNGPAKQLAIVDGSELTDSGPFLPLLSYRGVLNRGRRHWAVDLELNLWSDSRCQLGLRPRLRYVTPLSNDAMFDTGAEALAAIAAAMVTESHHQSRPAAARTPVAARTPMAYPDEAPDRERAHRSGQQPVGVGSH